MIEKKIKGRGETLGRVDEKLIDPPEAVEMKAVL
jgi:hypothetical protein